MKSVLHIRLDAPTFSSNGIEAGLKAHFEEYSSLNWQSIRFNENILALQDRIVAKSYMEEPDVVFFHIQNAGILDGDTLQSMYPNSFKVLYTFDKREDLGWIKDLAPHLGLVLLPDTDSVLEMGEAGFINCEQLSSSADYELYKPYSKKPPRWSTSESDLDTSFPEIVFIGNRYDNTSLDFPQAKQRRNMVERLQSHFGDKFGVFGGGWKGSRLVNTQEEINLYNGCKIAITHNNFNAGMYSSDRIWRSMGCGAFTISQYYYGINQEFRPGVLKTWLDFDMLVQECEKYLKLNREREAIAKAGSLWVREHHSWSARVDKMMKLIEKHKLGKYELGQSSAAN